MQGKNYERTLTAFQQQEREILDKRYFICVLYLLVCGVGLGVPGLGVDWLLGDFPHSPRLVTR